MGLIRKQLPTFLCDIFSVSRSFNEQDIKLITIVSYKPHNAGRLLINKFKNKAHKIQYMCTVIESYVLFDHAALALNVQIVT